MGTVHALMFVAGLVVLVAGAEAVVRGGSDVATRMGVRPIVVGMTVVSLGTSLPELAIGLSAVADGNGDLAVGNIVGTNLVNTLLVLGLAALLSPIGFERRTLRFDLPVAAVAALVLLLLARDGSLSSGDGLVLTAYGVAYGLVHDVYIHGRLPLFRRRHAALERWAAAHRVHHLFSGEPYGMLLPLVPVALRERALRREGPGRPSDPGWRPG